jgi:hypothetical protein
MRGATGDAAISWNSSVASPTTILPRTLLGSTCSPGVSVVFVEPCAKRPVIAEVVRRINRP